MWIFASTLLFTFMTFLIFDPSSPQPADRRRFPSNFRPHFQIRRSNFGELVIHDEGTGPEIRPYLPPHMHLRQDPHGRFVVYNEITHTGREIAAEYIPNLHPLPERLQHGQPKLSQQPSSSQQITENDFKHGEYVWRGDKRVGIVQAVSEGENKVYQYPIENADDPIEYEAERGDRYLERAIPKYVYVNKKNGWRLFNQLK